MENNVKDFKVGQKWLSRDGEVVTIIAINQNHHDEYKISGRVGENNYNGFTNFGEYIPGEVWKYDLISLVEDKQVELLDEQIATIFDDYRDIDDDINAVAFARKVIDAYKKHCK